MANIQNLKPYKKGELSSEEAKKRGRKGGLAKTEAKKVASQLRDLKKAFLLEKADIDGALERIRDSELFAWKYMAFAERLIKEAPTMNQKDRISLFRAYGEAYTRIHGQKSQVEHSGHTTQDVRVAEIIKIALDAQKKPTKPNDE